jgi:predicted esterase
MSASTATAPKRKGALIFLHGLGDSPSGWASLQHQLPRLQPRLADIEYIFPAAPIIPLSINGGGTQLCVSTCICARMMQHHSQDCLLRYRFIVSIFLS